MRLRAPDAQQNQYNAGPVGPLLMYASGTSGRTEGTRPVPELVLGPILRHAGPTDATVWVETDAACEVEVLGHSSPTFRVGGHHYALIHVTGLQAGEACEYEVCLDDRMVWPEPGSPFPPSVIRPMKNGE